MIPHHSVKNKHISKGHGGNFMSQILQTWTTLQHPRLWSSPQTCSLLKPPGSRCSGICVWYHRPARSPGCSNQLRRWLQEHRDSSSFPSGVREIPGLACPPSHSWRVGNCLPSLAAIQHWVSWGTKKYHFTCTPVAAFPFTNVKTSLIFSDKNVNKETSWPRGCVIGYRAFHLCLMNRTSHPSDAHFVACEKRAGGPSLGVMCLLQEATGFGTD